MVRKAPFRYLPLRDCSPTSRTNLLHLYVAICALLNLSGGIIQVSCTKKTEWDTDLIAKLKHNVFCSTTLEFVAEDLHPIEAAAYKVGSGRKIVFYRTSSA